MQPGMSHHGVLDDSWATVKGDSSISQLGKVGRLPCCTTSVGEIYLGDENFRKVTKTGK